MTCLRFSRLIVRACCLALLASSIAHAGPGDWSGQGPFGGSIGKLKVDPLVATRLYASTANGFFRSDDAGSSWSVRETGLLDAHPSNSVFAISASVPGRMWLFDDVGRLYGSIDGGSNWLATGYSVTTNVALGTVSLADGAGNTTWLANDSAGLLTSTDGGITFAPVAGGFPSGQTVALVVTSPHDLTAATQHVIASTSSNCDPGTGVCPIYVSANGGATWSASIISGALTQAGAAQRLIAAEYGPGGTVYALYGDVNFDDTYLLRSSDNGAHWSGAPTQYGSALAASPSTAATLWLDSARSIDGGAIFTPLGTVGLNTNGTFVPRPASIAVSPGYPATPRLWIGTPYAGVYLSNDDGATWVSSNDGIAATNIRSVIVHPTDNTRIFAGFGDSIGDPSAAFYRSTSVGTWTASNTGLNAYQLRTVLIDPTTAGTVGSTVLFGVGSGFDWSGGHAIARNSGIYKSLDGGLTWATQSGGTALNNGFSSSPTWPGNLRTVIADPRSCDARGPTAPPCSTGPLQTFYATGGGRSVLGLGNTAHPYRVIKSIDGGASWSDSSVGIPDDIENPDGSQDRIDGVTPIVMDPSDSRILYIGTFASAFGPDAAGNPQVSPQVLSGVYKSVNGGASWTRVSNGLPTYGGSNAVYDTLSLAIDAANPQTLWVSTISADFNIPGEIYKTINGGTTWFVSNAGITGPDVRALLSDPLNPGTVYAASGGLGPANPGGVYKSTDGGSTWKSISVGLPSFSATALTLDPVDPTVLFAGTGGGVYSIVQLPDTDTDGVPDLIENSGPNGGDANHSGGQDSTESGVGTTAPGLFGGYGWQSGTANASQAARLSQLQQSIQSLKTPQMQMAAGNEATGGGIQGGYFTTEVSGCAQAVDVAPVIAGPLGLDVDPHRGTYTYPRGLVRFELPQCASAVVKITFNTASFGAGWSWRIFGPSTPGNNATMGWHDGSSLVTARGVDSWTIQLTKGQYGSYRPAGTGAILFEGGPAYTETIFRDKFE